MTHASKPSMSMCASVDDYRKQESQYLESLAKSKFVVDVGPRSSRPESDEVLAQSKEYADSQELYSRHRWDLRFYDYMLGFVTGYVAHEDER